MATILCVLYPDPENGFPPKYARDSIPALTKYADGQSLPTPSTIDFTPGELLGSVSGALGLKKYLADLGHEFIVTDSKEGADSVFEQVLPRAEIIISQPFWPAYLTPERIAKAKKI